MTMRMLAAVAAVAVVSSMTVSAEQPAGGGSALKGLEVGTRILHIQLREDSRGTGTPTREDNFLGSIDRLEEEQNYAPVRAYLQYFVNDYIGAGISYDTVEADARDANASDGILEFSGPILYVVGRLPTEYYWTPFVELGVAFYNASFSEDEEWADTGTFERRYMEVEDSEALVVAVGCDYNFTENLSANVYARLVDGAKADAGHFQTGNTRIPRQVGDFVLDYIGFGAGLKYAF